MRGGEVRRPSEDRLVSVRLGIGARAVSTPCSSQRTRARPRPRRRSYRAGLSGRARRLPRPAQLQKPQLEARQSAAGLGASCGAREATPPLLRRSAPLPWNASGNWSQPTATVFAYLSRSERRHICHRLSTAAAAGLQYATCCLELYNHITEHATYRRCQNPICGLLFVRQRGRAEQGQYRSQGVKYCSNTCARAQAQRQFRARKKAAARTKR
jgi:hypothetical protein